MHNYTNQGNVGAGEKDPNVIREIVQEIVRKAKKHANNLFGNGALTHDFGLFNGGAGLSPHNDNHLKLDEVG